MSDFIFAALPWIALGITVAVVVANNSSKKKDKYQSNEKIDSIAKEKTDKKGGEENYATSGMLFGMAFGTAIGSSFIDTFGTIALTYGICFGMLIGALIGIFLKKK